MPGQSWIASFVRRNRQMNALYFPGAGDDPWRWFRQLVARYRTGASVIVDLGSGPIDAYREWIQPEASLAEDGRVRVLSVDQEWASLRRNPGKFRIVADAGRLPLRECSADLILSRYAFEHVRHALPMVREAVRVLKPGKSLVFVTPHRRCYVSLLARLTPVWLHRVVYRLLGHSGNNLPFCPTYYRLNTPRTIRARASEVGLETVELRVTVGQPEYTKILPPVFHRMFVRFHCLLEDRPWLREHFGVNLIGVLQKKPPGGTPLTVAAGECRAAAPEECRDALLAVQQRTGNLG